jgi:hypothetical protein
MQTDLDIANLELSFPGAEAVTSANAAGAPASGGRPGR